MSARRSARAALLIGAWWIPQPVLQHAMHELVPGRHVMAMSGRPGISAVLEQPENTSLGTVPNAETTFAC